MIIDTVKGDLIALFKQGKGHLIHGCNCFHTMGGGIAAKIAKEFPQALAIDKKTIRGDAGKLGGFNVWHHKVNGYNWMGINLYVREELKDLYERVKVARDVAKKNGLPEEPDVDFWKDLLEDVHLTVVLSYYTREGVHPIS